jgi:hypothetical protein
MSQGSQGRAGFREDHQHVRAGFGHLSNIARRCVTSRSIGRSIVGILRLIQPQILLYRDRNMFDKTFGAPQPRINIQNRAFHAQRQIVAQAR